MACSEVRRVALDHLPSVCCASDRLDELCATLEQRPKLLKYSHTECLPVNVNTALLTLNLQHHAVNAQRHDASKPPKKLNSKGLMA